MKLTISSLTNGVLDVSIEQKEKLYNQESTYPLDFSITLINDDNLRNDKVWDLIKGDKLYFVKSNDALFGQIKIKEDVESGDGNGDNSGTENPIYEEIIITNIKIYKNKNKYENYEFNENPLNIYIEQGKHDIEITLNEKYDNLNVSSINLTHEITKDGKIIKFYNVILNNNNTVTINIGYQESQTVDISSYTKRINIIASD